MIVTYYNGLVEIEILMQFSFKVTLLILQTGHWVVFLSLQPIKEFEGCGQRSMRTGVIMNRDEYCSVTSQTPRCSL